MSDSTVMDSVRAEEAAEQRSIKWLYDRCGYVTASNFAAVMDFTKAGKSSAKRDTYFWKVVTERIRNEPVTNYTNDAMQWGVDNEGLARMAYEAQTGNIVEETGFIKHPLIEWVGGSPDGLVDADGLTEFKCPFGERVHFQTILQGMPDDHIAQVQGLMWITGRQWCDFASFDPRNPANMPHLQLYVQRIERDDEYIAKLHSAVMAFLGEVTITCTQLVEGK